MAAPTTVRSQKGAVLFERAWIMEGFLERARGLIGSRRIDPSGAWIFEHCGSVHTFFMSCEIDVVETDDTGRVVSIRTLRPWLLMRAHPDTAHVIEVAAGSAERAGAKIGDVLTWR